MILEQKFRIKSSHWESEASKEKGGAEVMEADFYGNTALDMRDFPSPSQE